MKTKMKTFYIYNGGKLVEVVKAHCERVARIIASSTTGASMHDLKASTIPIDGLEGC